ncbi:outer membrane beta-barrel protein [Pseudopedobacter beijingensis]|uniref:Outer membrane beta-barrel protein n=1 Tax=Pseudopedobacter beijingensis TaxID=1207056 RepID=A0ABW4I7U1_9SPHI
MKKLLLSIAVLSGLAFTTQAQTEKGNFILGGSVGFNTSKVDGASKSDVDFNVVPNIGYFLNDNIAIGTGVGYKYAKSVTLKEQGEAFVVAPFGRYYVNLSDQFKFYGQLSVPMEFGTAKFVDANGDTGAKLGTATNIGVNVAPGFAFFPTKRIGIEFSVAGLSYDNKQLKDEATGAKLKTNSFGLNADAFAPKLGVQFHF